MQFSEVRGAIFNLDDTLLDNGPVDEPTQWLHSRSRLAALHQVGAAHDIAALQSVTAEENGQAFITAPVHSLPSAIWNVFYMKGMVASPIIDTGHTHYPLVKEIARLKDTLHETILRQYGVEVAGATAFVRSLAARGLANHLALATNAIHRDITIFLDKYDLHAVFPERRIISGEMITHPKPHPECFDRAFQALNLPDSARPYVLAFEDNPRGIASAKAAGLYVCAITSRLRRDDPVLLAAEPDLIADSYSEFRQRLGV